MIHPTIIIAATHEHLREWIAEAADSGDLPECYRWVRDPYTELYGWCPAKVIVLDSYTGDLKYLKSFINGRFGVECDTSWYWAGKLRRSEAFRKIKDRQQLANLWKHQTPLLYVEFFQESINFTRDTETMLGMLSKAGPCGA